VCENYATLEDLEFDTARKERLLFGLLNARVVLAALRSALVLHRLDYPADLGDHIRSEVFEAFGSTFSVGSTGEDLHRWATKLEGAVCDAIDSFGGSDLKRLPEARRFQP